jgi:phosphoadenosine phosphosulfate reductase
MAIERIKEMVPAALKYSTAGYYLAFSGGKDSVVLLDLFRRAGVPYTAYYHLTTVDPPELVKFVKTFSEVIMSKPKMSMWQLIAKKGMPPRRNSRYCCEVLKEGGGDGRLVATGVRWGESKRRSRRGMIEPCLRNKRKHYFHPIIDWTDADVWAYIREHHLDYCTLDDEGWKRLGCVLCPMVRKTKEQIARWPRLAKAWERAVKKTWNPSGKTNRFGSAQEYWEWWLDRDAPRFEDSQLMIFDDEGTAYDDRAAENPDAPQFSP